MELSPNWERKRKGDFVARRKIAVLGSGGWGTAIAILLSENGHHVTLWSYFQEEAERLAALRENKDFLPGVQLPADILCTNDMEKAVNGSDVVVCASPSHAVRATMKSFAPFYKSNTLLVNISKGLEENSLMRMSQVITDEIPNAKVVVLSGPSHAEEVSRGIPTANVAASDDVNAAQELHEIFMCPTFRV